ncbi:histidine phosphatase family protein [Angustibacter aerolatus]
MTGHLVLVRHGETEWSRSGQHTGLTDIPLTPRGEQQARALRAVFAERPPALVVTSPLSRARHTAELAGLTGPGATAPARVDDDLHEWDYGGYEGLTSAVIRETAGADWTVFRHGVVPGTTPGETVQEVAACAARVIGSVEQSLTEGDVVLVAHGHLLRVLATVWLDQAPTDGARLLLDPASTSRLGVEHGVRAVAAWNVPAA